MLFLPFRKNRLFGIKGCNRLKSGFFPVLTPSIYHVNTSIFREQFNRIWLDFNKYRRKICNNILNNGWYVGAEISDDDGEPFEEKMEQLTADLAEQFSESEGLEGDIRENLKGHGYGISD